MNAGEKGEWAKAVVTADLLAHGIEAYRAVSPAASVQLIVVHDLPHPVRFTPLAVRCALLKPTKDDPERLAYPGRIPDGSVGVFVTPDGRALYAARTDWWADSALALCYLDGPTIVPVSREVVTASGGWCVPNVPLYVPAMNWGSPGL